MAASAYGTRDDIHTLVHGDFQYPWATAEIVKMLKEMVETRQTPPHLDDMVEAIAVIEAFGRARDTGRPARVADFLA